MTIEIRSLTHVYLGSAENVVALSALDIELPSAAVTVVRGSNGSGKTTLVRILAGELAPTAGHVRLSEGDRRPHVVTINQFGNVVPELTAAEHASLLGIHVTSVAAHGSAPVGVLTHAQRQHLAVDLAVALNPDIVLADEPTAFLSHEEAVDVYDTLAAKCRAAGVTLLLVTHDGRAEAIADLVVRLRDGRVAERWEPGGPEQQAVDRSGWLRLPENVRPRFGSVARVVDGPTVTLAGAEAEVPATAPTTRDPQAPITHVVGRSPLDAQAYLDSQWQAARGAAALFTDATALGTAQTLTDMRASAVAIERLGLHGLSRRPLGTLSGGQRQRAMLAIALSHTADILIVDEPTASLDTHWRDEAMAALREHAAAGHTVIVGTRDVDTVATGDHVVNV